MRFGQSGGRDLPGTAGVAGAHGSGVDLVVVPFAVDMCPAVGEGSYRCFVHWTQLFCYPLVNTCPCRASGGGT